jgi:hypothetical protein
MTAQARECILYKGEENWMATEPLEQYLHNINDIKFVSPCSACWRGYYGKWEIRDNKLYLVELEAYIDGYKKVDLSYLFPKQEIVLANWYTGEIRIPQGDLLEYVHMSYDSTFDKDLILQFDQGILLDEKLIDNQEEFHKRKSIEL